MPTLKRLKCIQGANTVLRIAEDTRAPEIATGPTGGQKSIATTATTAIRRQLVYHVGTRDLVVEIFVGSSRVWADSPEHEEYGWIVEREGETVMAHRAQI